METETKETSNSENGNKIPIKERIKGFKRELIVFAITFTLNSSLMFLMFLAPYETQAYWVGMTAAPLLGGFIRGFFSKNEGKKFLIFTFFWGVFLACVYIPFYGVLWSNFDWFGLYVMMGSGTAAIMYAASGIGFALRNSKLKQIRIFQKSK